MFLRRTKEAEPEGKQDDDKTYSEATAISRRRKQKVPQNKVNCTVVLRTFTAKHTLDHLSVTQ